MAVSTTTVEAKATLRYLRVSPTKVRPILDLIRGMAVEDAERLLQLTPRAAGDDVLKLLESAIANAEHLHAVPAEELYIKVCFCDEGPTRSHGRPRARGRYFRTRKRSSHITIVVARFGDDELEQRRRKAEAATTPAVSSRRARSERVRRSRAAASGHDHDHEGHDHDHDHDDHEGHDHDHDHDDHDDAEATDDASSDAVIDEASSDAGDEEK